MKGLKKVTVLLLVLSLLLSGCGKKASSAWLLQIGDEVFTTQEAMVFLLSQHTIYAGEYGEEIWNVQLSEGSFESYVKDAMLDYLERLFLTDCAAKASGIVLSVAEGAAAEKAADAFYQELNEETLENTGLTREICVQAFERYARVQIFYRQIMGRGTDEVSEEEARAIRIQIIALDKSFGLETAKGVLNLVSGGISPSEAIRDMEGASLRQETIVRGTYAEDFDTLVFALKKDKWSPVITMQNEYLLVQCLSVYEAEATAINKAAMEKENRETQLKEALTTYGADIRLVLDRAEWEEVSMSGLAGLSPANFYLYAAALMADY